MTEADILAMTYDDDCNVYRPFKGQLETGESVFKKGLEGKKINDEKIPCALSTQSGGKPRRNLAVKEIPTEWMLFARPDTDIQAGDTIEVAHRGKTILAVAGLPERLASHIHVPLVSVKEYA